MAKCKVYNLSPSYSYKHFKCRCAICVSWKLSANKTNDPIKTRKRIKRWHKANPEKAKQYAITAKFKKIILCRNCKNILTRDRRKSGVITCSEKCAKILRNFRHKKFVNKITKVFHKYKESKGCKRCKYDNYGGSIDFHHIDPAKKELRISADRWFSKNENTKKEVKKCILLCKNCHYEIHQLFRTNETKYWEEMKFLQSKIKAIK